MNNTILEEERSAYLTEVYADLIIELNSMNYDIEYLIREEENYESAAIIRDQILVLLQNTTDILAIFLNKDEAGAKILHDNLIVFNDAIRKETSDNYEELKAKIDEF